MKKIIGLIICILSVCVFNICASADTIEDNLGILQTIGIGEDLSEVTLQPEKEVTRAAFISNVIHLINASDQKSDTVYYHDVSRDYWAFDTISTMTSMGYISGSNGMFYPDNIISKTEAFKIVLSILGYDMAAQNSGGYPDGYLQFASSLGLADGISSGANVTMQDMYSILVNALDAPTMVMEGVGANAKYYQDNDTTLLSKYYDMYIDDGTLTGADTIDLSSNWSLPAGRVIINNETMMTELSLAEYLGCDVKYMYRLEDNDKYVVWVKAKTQNEILELSYENECSFDESSYTLEYSVNNSAAIKKIKLDAGVNVVLNGETCSEGLNEIFNCPRYTLKLVKTKGSSRYDVAIVWSYVDYLVGSIDKDKKIIYDKNNWSRSVCLDEGEYNICEITLNGSESSFDSIQIDYVVSVYLSKRGTRVKADISAATVSGNVSTVNTTEGILVVDGTEYELYDVNADPKCSPGDNVTLYLDNNGYIAAVKRSSGNGEFAFLMNGYFDDSGDDFYFKLMDSNGSIERVKCAESLKLDGTKIDKSRCLSFFMGEESFNQQLVWLSRNASSEITNIDTVNIDEDHESKDTSLHVFQTEASRMYKWTGKLGYTLLLNDDTRIFAVPSAANRKNSSDEDYYIKRKRDLSNDQNYMTTAFRVGDNETEYEEVLLITGYNWSDASTDSALILVSNISEGLNDSGEETKIIEGWQGISEVELCCDSSFNPSGLGVAEGDLISVSYNRDGDIKSANIVYDYSEDNRRVDTDINNSMRIVVGYASDKIGNVVRCGYSDGRSFDEVYDMTNAKILIFDNSKSREKIRIGNLGDIHTYKMSGHNCSTVVSQSNWGSPILYVVYNR